LADLAVDEQRAQLRAWLERRHPDALPDAVIARLGVSAA